MHLTDRTDVHNEVGVSQDDPGGAEHLESSEASQLPVVGTFFEFAVEYFFRVFHRREGHQVFPKGI